MRKDLHFGYLYFVRIVLSAEVVPRTRARSTAALGPRATAARLTQQRPTAHFRVVERLCQRRKKRKRRLNYRITNYTNWLRNSSMSTFLDPS